MIYPTMTTPAESIQETLIRLRACEDAREWAKGKTWSDAAADAAYADARIKSQKETADICRKYLPIKIWNL